MRSVFLWLLQLAAVILHTQAVTVYITDLPNYSLLAPCAQTAASSAVQYLTYNVCPGAVTALQTCACTQDKNGASVASSISSYVLDYCGSTASEDVSSASVVFDNYCHQDKTAAPFAEPTNIVTQYISDLPAFSDLGPCAMDGLSGAMYTMSDKCPLAASQLATCACFRNQNSLLLSELINTSIQNYCGSSSTADIASAQAVFSGYCGLNNGTSDFPTVSELPGSLTYYIYDMAEYSSLAPCAQTIVSQYAFATLTYHDCPSGPGALASCACAKGGNPSSITSGMKTAITDYCTQGAKANMDSVLSLFDFYCSAAKGSVTPAGITVSETTSAYGDGGGASETGTSPYGTNKYSAPTPTKTNGGSGSTSSPSNKSGAKKVKVPLGAIIGGSIGGVALIGLIIFGGWRYRRRHSPPPNPALNAGPSTYLPPDYTGKSELASNTITPIPDNKGSFLRKPMPSPTPSSVYPIQQNKPGELATPNPQNRAEAPGTTNAAELHPSYTQGGLHSAEMQGGNYVPHGMQRHEMDGMGANMNSGPVYEMPGHRGWS